MDNEQRNDSEETVNAKSYNRFGSKRTEVKILYEVGMTGLTPSSEPGSGKNCYGTDAREG